MTKSFSHRGVGSNQWQDKPQTRTPVDESTSTAAKLGALQLTTIAQDETPSYESPYSPELYIGGDAQFHLPYDTKQIYRRRPTQEQLDAAVEHGIPEGELGAAILLAGHNELSPHEIEQYLHVRHQVGPEKITEYVKRGYDLDEAETLAKLGGEPPELTEQERERWDDNWQAWEDKNRTVQFPDVNFVEGEYEIPIDEATFAVMDFETSGFSQDVNNRVLEIGIVVVDSKGNILKRLDTLVRCDDAAHDDDAEGVHKIDLATLKDAPTFEEIYPQVAEMLNGSIIVAQNKAFEQHHLSGEISRLVNDRVEMPSICTVDLARRFVGDATPNHKLGTMCEYFNVPLGGRAHMAIADAEATAQMLVGYLDHAKAQGRTSLYSSVPMGNLPAAGRTGRKVNLLTR